jgi:signal transduction histidine kinase
MSAMSEGESNTDRAPSLKPFEGARLALLRLGLQHTEELERSLVAAARICAESMKVHRVGIWVFDGADRLRSVAILDERNLACDPGHIFDLSTCPAYAAAIRSRRVIAVTDAEQDPKTCEMRELYLRPYGITSMMDAPFYADGEILGVICVEHIGPLREWSQADCDFAATVADIVSSLFQQARRLESEAQLSSLRERLANAERMHSLARLAAGVAHDLNNLLSVILLNAGALPSSVQARTIEEQCQAGATLARQLLAFARDTPPEVEVFDLRDTLVGMESLLRSALGPGIQLRLSLGHEPLKIQANKVEFQQILLNLAFNAREAMPRGGHFCLEGGLLGGQVTLRASDDGVGMTLETQARAFDPFFTTRKERGGTGMGLAIVYGAMRRARGEVSVQSVEGQGTTFELRWAQA